MALSARQEEFYMAQEQNGLFVMTRRALRSSKKELDYLLKTKRAEVAEKIRVARGFR